MNLRPRFHLLTILLFVAAAIPGWLAVQALVDGIVEQWAVRYAERQVLYDKSRMLQPILRDFTKAVLRERPEDVLLFSRDYFVAKWSEQRMGALTCLHAHQLLPPAASLTEPSL